ncbi:hypothetical protein [Methylosinus sp. LW3]|uniref:hypothetical protein n=1 Tax=Methylosinus sp. LW3 TaxID=107635 RepID=UPI000465F434|nr:hypothetical protein [Methylosinus sp. LW3]
MLDCDRSFQTTLFKATPNEAGLLLALLGRELAGAEGLIEGMLHVGLGVDAIAAYLGSARTTILDEISSRGIPIGLDQLEKPFRPRNNAWSLMDHTLFIVGWTCGVHVPALAELLGRSAGSLYGKRRRIGLPTRRAAPADGRRKTKRPKNSDAASATTRFGADAAATGNRKRTRRQQSPEAFATPAPRETSEILQTAPDVSSTPMDCPVTEAAATQEMPAPQEEPANPSLTTPPTDRPSEPKKKGRFVAAKKKKQSTRRKVTPSTLSPDAQPEWSAAIDDFIANRLPAGVDTGRHPALKNYVTSAIAILGGMRKAAIEEATGFSRSCISSHVERTHISSKTATNSTFDRQRYENALKVWAPTACSVTGALIFRAPGDHGPSYVQKSNERRRNAGIGKHATAAAAAEHKRKDDALAAGVEIRRGVSLRAVKCLLKPFDMNI